MPAAIAFTWLGVLTVAPLVIWHRVLSDIVASFHWNFAYVVGELSPWLLLLLGVLCMVPVALSAGRHPESRLYPRARRTYIAWGTVVYLLGVVLAVQVAALWHYTH